MAPPQKVTDEQILEAVAGARRMYGACTFALLEATLGLSRTGMRDRVLRLVEQKQLQISEVPGSIRLAEGATASATG